MQQRNMEPTFRFGSDKAGGDLRESSFKPIAGLEKKGMTASKWLF